MKTLREYIDQLDEISRRDFLKGVGATAGLAATGGVKAVTDAEKARAEEMARKVARLKAMAAADGGGVKAVTDAEKARAEEIARLKAMAAAEIDEAATPDAVRRIEQLVQYK